MQILKDIFYLFYPNICVTCNKTLLQNEKIMCTLCRHDLPIIHDFDFQKNEIIANFYGRVPIKKAMSFLFFRKEGKTKELIHQLKYQGNQKIGTFLGEWFGNHLKKSKEFENVDYIVPVPLDQKKLKKRGYNQLTTFGNSLSKILKIPYKPDILIRTFNTKTQTFKKRFERFNNMNTKFYLTDCQFFKNKHILLIDDVITTGSTLEACCYEILKTTNITISIVTIAYTEK